MTAQVPRILSWQQLVLEADPDWQRSNLQPWIYSFSNTRLFYRQIPAYGTPPDSGLINNGGFLVVSGTEPYDVPDPQTPNAIYTNAGFLSATSGTTYQIGLSIFYPCTLDQLLLIGPRAWPQSQPAAGSGQIWNQAGFACVA